LGQRRTQGPSGSPDPWKRHISLDMCPLGNPRDLSTFILSIDEDRVVTCSTWSLNQGVILLQRCKTTPGQSRARGCLVAKAWNKVAFQNTSVSRKPFRPINQVSLPNPTADTIETVVFPHQS
jgi:hypothetical protein